MEGPGAGGIPESGLRDKTRDLFGDLFVPYDYRYIATLSAISKDPVTKESENILISTHVADQGEWFFANRVRKAAFDYEYQKLENKNEAGLIVANFSAEVRSAAFSCRELLTFWRLFAICFRAAQMLVL